MTIKESFKMFKRNISFNERKKETITKYELCVKGQLILRRKEKLILWISESKK